MLGFKNRGAHNDYGITFVETPSRESLKNAPLLAAAGACSLGMVQNFCCQAQAVAQIPKFIHVIDFLFFVLVAKKNLINSNQQHVRGRGRQPGPSFRVLTSQHVALIYQIAAIMRFRLVLSSNKRLINSRPILFIRHLRMFRLLSANRKNNHRNSLTYVVYFSCL